MTFHDIHSQVGSVPYITAENARFLYEMIFRERIGSILELGITHGTATCVIAAALQELGQGRITAVDLIDTQDAFQPTPEAQLHDTGNRLRRGDSQRACPTWFRKFRKL